MVQRDGAVLDVAATPVSQLSGPLGLRLGAVRLRREHSQGPVDRLAEDRLAVAQELADLADAVPSARRLRAVTFCSSVSSSCPASPTLARVAIGRAYERLEAGEVGVTIRDAVTVLRLAREMEHDDALAERDAARRQMEEWRQDGLACGSSATRSSGGTGRTPGRRSRPRSGSSALLRRGNRQPGWRGGCPSGWSVIPAASPPASPRWQRRRRAASRAFPARPARSRGQARGAGLSRPFAGSPGDSTGAGQARQASPPLGVSI